MMGTGVREVLGIYPLGPRSQEHPGSKPVLFRELVLVFSVRQFQGPGTYGCSVIHGLWKLFRDAASQASSQTPDQICMSVEARGDSGSTSECEEHRVRPR